MEAADNFNEMQHMLLCLTLAKGRGTEGKITYMCTFPLPPNIILATASELLTDGTPYEPPHLKSTTKAKNAVRAKDAVKTTTGACILIKQFNSHLPPSYLAASADALFEVDRTSEDCGSLSFIQHNKLT